MDINLYCYEQWEIEENRSEFGKVVLEAKKRDYCLSVEDLEDC